MRCWKEIMSTYSFSPIVTALWNWCMSSPESSWATCNTFCLIPSNLISESVKYFFHIRRTCKPMEMKNFPSMFNSYISIKFHKSYLSCFASSFCWNNLKANIIGAGEWTSFPSLLWLCGKLSCFLFLNPPDPYVEKEKKVGQGSSTNKTYNVTSANPFLPLKPASTGSRLTGFPSGLAEKQPCLFSPNLQLTSLRLPPMASLIWHKVEQLPN